MAVTIGICAFNEEGNIRALLNDLLGQELPFSTEIIVVSDGSTDATDSIVEEVVKKNSGVRLIRHSTRIGKSEALNTLFRQTQAEIVVTIAGDMRIKRGSVQKMVETIRSLPSVGMCWAKPIPIYPEQGLVERIGHLAFRLHDSFYKKLDLAGDVKHSTGELVAFRREAFTQIPADCVNDDEYLALQAARKGFKVQYVTETTAGASLPRTMLDYVKQRRRWVYGHFQIGSMLGEYPSVMEFSLTKRPMLVVSVVLNELSERPSELPVFLASLLVEFSVVLLALRDVALRVRHSPWDIVQSTKQTTA
jgi:biofilm PGA synthesis N-glycosyltransferase PgaC